MVAGPLGEQAQAFQAALGLFQPQVECNAFNRGTWMLNRESGSQLIQPRLLANHPYPVPVLTHLVLSGWASAIVFAVPHHLTFFSISPYIRIRIKDGVGTNTFGGSG